MRALSLLAVLPPLVGSPAVVGILGETGDLLRPVARAGDTRRVEFGQSLRLVMVSQEDTVLTDDAESPPSKGSGAEFIVEEREQVVFVDELLAVEDGAPRALKRTFERLDSRSTQTVKTASGKLRVRDGEGASPLAGRRVRFEPDEDGRLAARFDDERETQEGAQLLPGLEARWDLAPFLPEGAVAPDDEWSVPLSALRELSYPSGELGIAIEGDERGDAFGKRFHEHMRGTIRAHYLGRRARDGRELALVRLESALTTEFELVDDPSIRREYRFELALEGELYWDLEAQRAVSLDWSGPVQTLTVTTRVGTELGLRTRQHFEGSLTFSVRVE